MTADYLVYPRPLAFPCIGVAQISRNGWKQDARGAGQPSPRVTFRPALRPFLRARRTPERATTMLVARPMIQG